MIEKVNGRLKAARLPVRVEQRGRSLYLRATLPPRPGAASGPKSQQWISLGVKANPAGLKFAEQQARLLGGEMSADRFRWENWGESPILTPQTVGDIKDRFMREHPARGQVARVTWQTNYAGPLRRLPDDLLLDDAAIAQWITTNTTPHTQTRRRTCIFAGILCRWLGIEGDFKHLQGRYNARAVEPRDIPSEDEIQGAILAIADPQWRQLAGFLAAYGLRNHEVYRITEWGTVIKTQGKAGDPRHVWPFHPEWIDLFQLDRPNLPTIGGDQSNARLGAKISKALRKTHGLPFLPYALRHAWAIRSMEYGLDLSLAAAQMGHSRAVHDRLYHHWISRETHDRAYQVILSNPNRPHPPKIEI